MADSKPLENSTFASRAKSKDGGTQAKQVDDASETENKSVGSAETKKRTTARKS